MNDLPRARQKWDQQTLEPVIRRFPEQEERFETLSGIPLDRRYNAPAAILLAMYIAVAREQGVDPKRLRGTAQNDILKEYVARGTYIFPPRPSMRLVTDLIRYFRAGGRRYPGQRHRLRPGCCRGGTGVDTTNSLDEALGLPTEGSVRIARCTQQIIAYESGVAGTVDPLGGSYGVEYLTGEIERRAQMYLEQIDAMEGILAAIEQGYIQQEIVDAAYRYQQAVERGERIVVGVNAHHNW